MIKLENLLRSLSSNEVPMQDLEKTFDEIAVELLRETKIVTPNNQFYFREIEFYYRSPTHNDPYVHGKEGSKSTAARQGHFGEWYFHDFKHSSTFLKSKRYGLDITFGNKAEKTFGGILIRKIQNINNGELTIGINRVMRKLLENVDEKILTEMETNKTNKLDEIANKFGNLVFDENYIPPFRIE